jgi:hypothetical protein
MPEVIYDKVSVKMNGNPFQSAGNRNKIVPNKISGIWLMKVWYLIC